MSKKYPILSLRDRLQPHPDFTGRGVTIVFIDSGFYPHPELEERILAMIDVTNERYDEKRFKKVTAASWHGTMIAASVCGSGQWSDGYYRGLASEANVVLIKAFDGKKVRAANIAKGLQWVAKHHVRYRIKVVNISLGGDRVEHSSKSRICQSITALKKLGITTVVAAGNNPNKPLLPPASCPDAITVGGLFDQNSTDVFRYTEYGSTFGYNVEGIMKPEIAAPARYLPAPMLPDNDGFREAEILHELARCTRRTVTKKLKLVIAKTKLDKTLLKQRPEIMLAAIRSRLDSEKFFAPRYQHVDGTSFASPIVAAIVAQMIEANPELTPAMIKLIVETTALRLPQIAPEKQGFGLIRAKACVERALSEEHSMEIEKAPRILKDRLIFYYHHDRARKVCLIGDFTAWRRDVILMKEISDGLWRADIPLLSDGMYHYKFLIDDHEWVEDPLNPLKENDHHNGMNSVVIVKRDSGG